MLELITENNYLLTVVVVITAENQDYPDSQGKEDFITQLWLSATLNYMKPILKDQEEQEIWQHIRVKSSIQEMSSHLNDAGASFNAHFFK